MDTTEITIQPTNKCLLLILNFKEGSHLKVCGGLSGALPI